MARSAATLQIVNGVHLLTASNSIMNTESYEQIALGRGPGDAAKYLLPNVKINVEFTRPRRSAFVAGRPRLTSPRPARSVRDRHQRVSLR
jgi:hypothetical protein